MDPWIPAVSVTSFGYDCCSDVNVSKLGNIVEMTPNSFLYKMTATTFSSSIYSSIYPMSIFVRPDSPPPRQPSPDITPAPLPYPHHPRRVASQPKIRAVTVSPARPPGLQLPTRTVHSARSYDHITSAHNDDNSLLTPRKRTPPSLRLQQPFGPELNSRHMSTLTVTAVHRRSSVHVCPVANPPLPPSGPKRTLRPHPNSFDSLYLPEMDASAIPQRKPPSKSVLPALKKHKSLSMACLRFFRIRNSSQSQKPVTTTFGKLWKFIMQNSFAFSLYKPHPSI